MHHWSLAPRRHGHGACTRSIGRAASSERVPKAACSALAVTPGQICPPDGGHEVKSAPDQDE
eukprot:10667756-Alexandrium_andersonii.AAC.1